LKSRFRKHLGEGIAADYDSDGRLAGIEILDAVRRLGDPAVLRQVILADVWIRRRLRGLKSGGATKEGYPDAAGQLD